MRGFFFFFLKKKHLTTASPEGGGVAGGAEGRWGGRVGGVLASLIEKSAIANLTCPVCFPVYFDQIPAY